MVFRVGFGFFSSHINFQKRVWCSSTPMISNIADHNLKTTYFAAKHPLNFKITELHPNKLRELSFEEFKKTKIESFEEFANSDLKELLFNNDLEKIKKAYDKYCWIRYSTYQYKGQGNPLHVI